MKKLIFRSIISGFFFVITVVGVLFLTRATWNGLQSSPGDKLTSAIWNQLASKASVNFSKVSLSDYTTTATMTNVPGATINITTTGNNPILINLSAVLSNPTAVDTIQCDISVDGSRISGTEAFWFTVTGGYRVTANYNYTTSNLAAGSHTIILMCKSPSGYVKIRGASGGLISTFSAMELKQ